MPRKKRRSIIDDLFGGSFFNDTELVSNKFPDTRYSISVVQTPEGTKVKAKVGKNNDATAFKKQLQQQYPNAKIEIEGVKTEPLIREISTKTLNTENEENDESDG